ncbi:hypothetical protein HG530_007715 [Fusarium avenaceum]|nr:hypothetical protein HG530_007715 [Fusarium avenaceum]
MDSGAYDECGSDKTKDASKHLHPEPMSGSLEDCAIDRAGGQSTDRRDEEHNATAESDLLNRDEKSIGKEEETQGTEDEFGFAKRLEHLSAADLLRVWWMQRLDGEIGDDEKKENHEGANSHGPTKSDLLDETGDHDGEDNTAKTRSGGENTKGGSSVFVEPSVNRG